MDFLAGICGPQVEAAPALGAPLGVWLHDATPAEDKKNACSPALVNAKCSLEHGALEETFNGAATAWEIMAKSFEQYGERNALGARALKKREMEPDEKSGKAFEKLTYADAYDWVTYAELEKQTAALGSTRAEKETLERKLDEANKTEEGLAAGLEAAQAEIARLSNTPP